MGPGLGRPAEQRPPGWAGRTDGGTPAPIGRQAESIRHRRLSIVAIAAAVVALDQAAKSWALAHARDPVHVVWTLRLFVQFNSGTAFGLGQDSTAIIVGGVIVLVVVLLGLGRQASRSASWPAAVAMGLLLGGALGNLADRLVRHHHGAVVDFIDLRWWPVFNIADAAISVGAVLLALVFFRARPKAASAAGTTTAPSESGRNRPDAKLSE
jgi:signal peptidase II